MYKSSTDGRRALHIDVAKGLSIIFVVAFHSDLRELYPSVIVSISLFLMPLFFLLSGVFFSWIAPPKIYIFRKFDALLKPYFFIYLVYFLTLYFLIDKDVRFWEVRGALYGNGDTIPWTPMWFLTHLFLVFIFAYFLVRYIKILDSVLIGFAFSILMIFVGTEVVDSFWYRDVSLGALSMALPGLPFSADIILISSGFFLIGTLLRDEIINFQFSVLKLGFSVGIFLLISVFGDAHVDLNKRVYDNPLLATIGAFSGIYAIVSISFLISFSHLFSRIFSVVGKSSLFILIFHLPVMNLISSLLSDTWQIGFLGEFFAWVVFFLGSSFPILVRYIVQSNDFLSLAFYPIKNNNIFMRNKL